ncbi:hypothetical protein [Streptomyces sp. NBC_01408]|uniref:hypothetical protein n=1 Tax=Streptomyces sp. NBC_01408 TaxID=2903855 RepID=UPI002258FD92|nr:hypothetical protein [Streptomyces sp. NBC_01408]MCX4692266.1 hypothetical protein [Streptomyces sp. NBC_01408]
MIQGFRPSRWLACAVLAAAALTPAASAVSAAPSAAVREDDDGHPDLAGSAAGAGRERPGRPAAEPPNPEAVAAARPLRPRPRTEPVAPPRPPSPVPTAVATATATPRAVTALGTEPNERAADLAAHILPLGTGFALMGIGLGYLGMRLRKGI